jgi:hypothetical protein
MRASAVALAGALSIAACGGRDSPPAAAPGATPKAAETSASRGDAPAAPSASSAAAKAPGTKAALPDTKCPLPSVLEASAGCVVTDSPAADSFRKAMAAYRAWLGTGTGSGPAARAQAFAALSAFHEKWASDGSARAMVVEVAYATSFLLHAGEEKDARAWDRKTIEAWERLAKDQIHPDILRGTRPSELAALAELASIDREIWDTFDYETGHLHLEGTVARATTELAAAEKRADALHRSLDRVAGGETYGSPRAIVDAIARQGSLYESLRAALLPAEAVTLQGSAAERDAWTKRREKGIAAAEDVMVTRYATAIAAARGYGVASTAVKRAWKRLGDLETPIGEARMRGLVAGTGLTYSPGMFKAPFAD